MPISSTPTATAALVPLVRVPFREGYLLAAEGHYDQEGDRPVILRPFCDALGIDTDSQRQKLRGKPWATTVIITVVAEDGKTRGMLALPLRALPMWLATINPSKVAPEARPMLESYQREAAEVLFRHFLTHAPAAPPALPGADLLAARAQLATVVWALGLPPRAPSKATSDADPAADLAADVAYLGRLVGLDPLTGEYPDGVIVPSIASRSQTVMRLRAWLAEATRPFTYEEARDPRRHRGLTGAELAASYNRWARARGLGPLSPGALGRWLSDETALSGRPYRSTHHSANRYALVLLTSPAPAAQLAAGEEVRRAG